MGNIKNSMDIIWIKLLYFNSWKFYLFDYVVVSKRNRISLYDCVSLFVYEVLNALIIRVSSRMVNIGQFIRELRKKHGNRATRKDRKRIDCLYVPISDIRLHFEKLLEQTVSCFGKYTSKDAPKLQIVKNPLGLWVHIILAGHQKEKESIRNWQR